MPEILKYFFIFICGNVLFSCTNSKNDRADSPISDTLMLKINFRPAFNECSETVLVEHESQKYIHILIKNDVRADETQDTFWFKKIILTEKQYQILDSGLIKLSRQKYLNKEKIGVDGITISSALISKTDTNYISFWSPDKTSEFEYNFTRVALTDLKTVFQDTIVTQYLEDIECYIDESKCSKADPKRKIDQLRMKKYNWLIQQNIVH